MKLFVIKIQLNNHTEPDDYDVLHKALYARQFYQTVYLTSGHWHDMPRAMYIKKAEAKNIQVLNEIKRIMAVSLPGFKPANIATDKERSYEIVLTMSDTNDDGYFEAKFVLKQTTDAKKLPPNKKLK